MYRSSPVNAPMNAGGVVAPLEREACELEGGDPSLGAPLERGDLRLAQRQAHRTVQVLGRLLGREPKVGDTHLGKLPAGSEPGQGQRRVHPAGDQQVQCRRGVVQEERDAFLHLGAVDHVVVVEHQDHVVAECIEGVEQRGQEPDRGRRVRRMQQLQLTRAERGRHLMKRGAEGGDHVGPEGGGVVVAGIQRHPGNGGRLG